MGPSLNAVSADIRQIAGDVAATVAVLSILSNRKSAFASPAGADEMGRRAQKGQLPARPVPSPALPTQRKKGR
jgi:hypothetical protein